MPAETKTAILLDQYPLWLDALERLLDQVGITAIAKTTDPQAALDALSERRPQLFVLDTDLNGSTPDGLTCLAEACARNPSLKAVVVAASEDRNRVDAALNAGAIAYVLKRAHPDDVAAAFRQVFTRSLYLAGELQPELRSVSPATAAAAAAAAAPAVEEDDAGLTPREHQILRLVAEGNTNGDVARRLWVTEQTVKFHLANVFRKLDVSNRTQASRWAHAHGLVQEAAAPDGVELATTG
jgi:DNA-binding NarL/FixJ family response regulator